MINLAEVSVAMDGTLRLLSGDPAALSRFDLSEAGFWRSFRVGILVVPLLVLMIAMVSGDLSGTTDATRVAFGEVLGFGLNWFGFPLLVAAIARLIGLERTFAAFIIVRNWSVLVGLVPYVAVFLAYGIGLFGASAFGYAQFMAFGFNLYLGWRVARVAAAAPAVQATGLVVLGVLVDFLCAHLVNLALGN